MNKERLGVKMEENKELKDEEIVEETNTVEDNTEAKDSQLNISDKVALSVEYAEAHES